jgi:hypothetical protein
MRIQHTVARWGETGREASLNWLALGLLLAAWNFSDNDAVASRGGRPPPLENHPLVTVRAARSCVAQTALVTKAST